MYSEITAPAFPTRPTSELFAPKEGGTIKPKQPCRGKLALLSNECNSSKEPSELSTGDRPPPALSGLVISFGKTLPYLACKTVTRRAWKDSHASKFASAFERNKLVRAFDKDRRCGGKQIGWCRLLCAPYKERLSAMPDGDLIAEGGMCSTVAEFVKRYFKGNSSIEVWVIRFEFIALNALTAVGSRSDSDIKTDTYSSISSASSSIHQTSLTGFGVCPKLENETNTSFPIPSLALSIHQTTLAALGVYWGLENKTNANSPIASHFTSIHQALLVGFGVYQALVHKTNNNFPLYSPSESIYQDSLAGFSARAVFGNQTNTNYPILSPAASRHHVQLIAFGVCRGLKKETNTNPPILSLAESIHQTSLQALGVYPRFDNKTNTNIPIFSAIASIHQALSSECQTTFDLSLPQTQQSDSIDLGICSIAGSQADTNCAITSLQSIVHQIKVGELGVYSDVSDKVDTKSVDNPTAESACSSPTVQGGSGLVYSFWKGERIVNHYRYKVKVNGKWKVKSIHIPVGKLPQVKEAIANKLGVAAIATSILNRPL